MGLGPRPGTRACRAAARGCRGRVAPGADALSRLRTAPRPPGPGFSCHQDHSGSGGGWSLCPRPAGPGVGRPRVAGSSPRRLPAPLGGSTADTPACFSLSELPRSAPSREAPRWGCAWPAGTLSGPCAEGTPLLRAPASRRHSRVVLRVLTEPPPSQAWRPEARGRPVLGVRAPVRQGRPLPELRGSCLCCSGTAGSSWFFVSPCKVLNPLGRFGPQTWGP